MHAFWQDVRYGLRMLAKNPGFTAVAVLTLALGVGATTAIFSVIYGVLLRPLPYTHPEQIVHLWEMSDEGHRMNFADPNFADMRSQNHSLQGIAQYGNSLESVSGATEPSRTMVAYVSRDFFTVLGVQPAIGRGFAPEEQRNNAPATALVSYGYWKQSLGGTQDLASVPLKLEGQAASVIGVLPAGFRFPENSDIWIAREIMPTLPSRTAHNWNVIARLREGTSVNASRAELTGIAQRLKQQLGNDTAMVGVAMEPLREAMTSNVRPALIILFGASGFLLLIACANVVNLMLAQAAARERELSIRAALGAGRNRLIRQFLTEAFLISTIGGALGVLAAVWGLNGLLAVAPGNLPRVEEVGVNLPVLLFSLAVVFLVAIGLGIFGAVRATSGDPRAALNEGSQRQSGSVGKQRLGRLIIAGQLATTLVLLVGAGLLGRSLLRVLSVDPGFRTEGVLTMELALPDDPTKVQRVQFLNEVIARLRNIPGVQEVGGTNVLPLTEGGRADGSYVIMNPAQISPSTQDLIQRVVNGNLEKDPALLAEFSKFFDGIFKDQAHLGEADYCVASQGFFSTLGIPLLSGRLFNSRDTKDSQHVAVVSKSLADEKWPNQSPIGQTVEFGNMDGDPRLLTIVGLVGDTRDRSLESAPRPTIYVDYRQRPTAAQRFTIVMLAPGKPDAVFSSAREIVRSQDPDVPPRFSTFSNTYAASLGARRFSLLLVGIFSATALLLAMAGIYGVTTYTVAQRTREIGVRMALGASRGTVLGMVLKQGVITGVLGVGAGILGSLVLTRWLQSQLFGVSATDPATFAGVALILILVSLAACWIPGRRAARVDPMVALRYE
jgi:ABC-type antimicrobial peptide transport system permease subunit